MTHPIQLQLLIDVSSDVMLHQHDDRLATDRARRGVHLHVVPAYASKASLFKME